MPVPGAPVARLAMTLRWGDCDPAGIIYYPTYYRWMDAASWALLAQAGFDAARMRAEQLTMPLSKKGSLSNLLGPETCQNGLRTTQRCFGIVLINTKLNVEEQVKLLLPLYQKS